MGKEGRDGETEKSLQKSAWKTREEEAERMRQRGRSNIEVILLRDIKGCANAARRRAVRFSLANCCYRSDLL